VNKHHLEEAPISTPTRTPDAEDTITNAERLHLQAMPKLSLQTHPRTGQPPNLSSQESISPETTDANNTKPQMAKQLNTY
jgi:hypothetical protein